MACEKDYSKGVIYTIRTDDGLYVGSSVDFKQRKGTHKSAIYNENCKEYNFKLYKNIRANNGEYRIEMYKPFPCNSKRELKQEEDKVMLEMNANLNGRRAYLSAEEKKEQVKECMKLWRENNRDKNNAYNKLYHEKNRDELNAKHKVWYEKNRDEINAKQLEKFTCECGCDISRATNTRHRKTKKHLKLMKELE